MLVARPVFAVACPSELCLDPLAGVCPIGIGALAFDAGEGAVGALALGYMVLVWCGVIHALALQHVDSGTVAARRQKF